MSSPFISVHFTGSNSIPLFSSSDSNPNWLWLFNPNAYIDCFYDFPDFFSTIKEEKSFVNILITPLLFMQVGLSKSTLLISLLN